MKQFLLAFFLLTSVAFTQNPILNSSNNALRANFYGNTALDLKGLPLGTSDGTATGEVGVKVKVIGSIATTSAASVSTTPATLTQTIKLVTTAGTPVALGTGLVESLEIHARKSVATANTGAIYVGFSATGGNNYRVLAVGESYPISAPAGKKINLATIYIDAATSGDGVIVTTSN